MEIFDVVMWPLSAFLWSKDMFEESMDWVSEHQLLTSLWVLMTFRSDEAAYRRISTRLSQLRKVEQLATTDYDIVRKMREDFYAQYEDLREVISAFEKGISKTAERVQSQELGARVKKLRSRRDCAFKEWKRTAKPFFAKMKAVHRVQHKISLVYIRHRELWRKLNPELAKAQDEARWRLRQIELENERIAAEKRRVVEEVARQRLWEAGAPARKAAAETEARRVKEAQVKAEKEAVEAKARAERAVAAAQAKWEAEAPARREAELEALRQDDERRRRVEDQRIKEIEQERHQVSYFGAEGLMPKDTSLVHNPTGFLMPKSAPLPQVPSLRETPLPHLATIPSGGLFSVWFSEREAKVSNNNRQIAENITRIRELERQDASASAIHPYIVAAEQARLSNLTILAEFATQKGLLPETYSQIQQAFYTSQIELNLLREKHDIEMDRVQRTTDIETKAFTERILAQQKLATQQKKDAIEVAEAEALSKIRVDEARLKAEEAVQQDKEKRVIDFIDYDRMTPTKDELLKIDALEKLYMKRQSIKNSDMPQALKKQNLTVVNARIHVAEQELNIGPELVPDANGKKPQRPSNPVIRFRSTESNQSSTE